VREADALSPGFDLASYPRDAWLRVLGVKLFADGSIGSHTAGLSRPFTDQAETRGRLLFTPDGLRERIRAILGRGLQPAVHAIGDAAIDEVVRCYEAEGVTSESRARIEHFELAGDGAIAACARMGVVASMQPNFIGEWGYPGMMYERRLGKDIVGTHNRLRAIADAGVPLAFGSDHMPYGPLYGLRHAVHGPAPAQRLSPVEALRAYTEGSAYAGFEEQEKGSILPGLLADIVIISEEGEGGPAPRERSAPSGPFGADLGRLVVEKTIVAGEVVYEAPRAAS
jgi:predicted amidohydrolase YtcJ